MASPWARPPIVKSSILNSLYSVGREVMSKVGLRGVCDAVPGSSRSVSFSIAKGKTLESFKAKYSRWELPESNRYLVVLPHMFRRDWSGYGDNLRGTTALPTPLLTNLRCWTNTRVSEVTFKADDYAPSSRVLLDSSENGRVFLGSETWIHHDDNQGSTTYSLRGIRARFRPFLRDGRGSLWGSLRNLHASIGRYRGCHCRQ